MPEPPKTAFLTRFRPGAAPEPSTPEPRLGLSLVTELRGVRQWAYADGRQLARELTIAFSRVLAHLCADARLVRLSPPGHAPLTLHSVAYNGSTCGIIDAATLLTVYLEGEQPDWTLAVSAPMRNLYPFYAWPQPVIEGLAEPAAGQPAARVDFALARFDNGNDTYGGVRYPMRLIIDRGSLGRVVVAERNRGDSPVVTGSGQRLTCADQPWFEVTAAQIAAALDAATPPAEPGVYPLDLVIYEGDGDQVFGASCLAATPSTDADPALPPPPVTAGGSFGEIRARRGGDYGVFELCRVPVAMLNCLPRAADFVIDNGVLGVACGGSIYAPAPSIGTRYWWNADKSELVTWDAGRIFRNGVQVILAVGAGAVLCAAATESGLAWVVGNASIATLYLRSADGVVTEIPMALPMPTREKTLLFSASGLRLAAYCRGRNGAVYETTVFVAPAWAEVEAMPEEPDFPVASVSSSARAVEASWRALDRAIYLGDVLTVYDVTLAFQYSAESAALSAEPLPDWPSGIQTLEEYGCAVAGVPCSGDIVSTSNTDEIFEFRVRGHGSSSSVSCNVSVAIYGETYPLARVDTTESSLAVGLYRGIINTLEHTYSSGSVWGRVQSFPLEGRGSATDLEREYSRDEILMSVSDAYPALVEYGHRTVTETGVPPIPEANVVGALVVRTPDGDGPTAQQPAEDLPDVLGWPSVEEVMSELASCSEAECVPIATTAMSALLDALLGGSIALGADGKGCTLLQVLAYQGGVRSKPRSFAGLSSVELPLAFAIVPDVLAGGEESTYADIPDWAPPEPSRADLLASVVAARASAAPLAEDIALNTEAAAVLDTLAALPADVQLSAGADHRLIGRDEPDAELMVMAWQASATHRARLLDPAWRRVGAHTADTPTHGRLWVVCFGPDP